MAAIGSCRDSFPRHRLTGTRPTPNPQHVGIAFLRRACSRSANLQSAIAICSYAPSRHPCTGNDRRLRARSCCSSSSRSDDARDCGFVGDLPLLHERGERLVHRLHAELCPGRSASSSRSGGPCPRGSGSGSPALGTMISSATTRPVPSARGSSVWHDHGLENERQLGRGSAPAGAAGKRR